MSNQSDRQAAIRAVTGTSGTYNEDWMALFDNDGIAAGTFNERFYAWLLDRTGLSGGTLDELMHAFAVSEGFDNWDAMGTFDAVGSIFDTLLIHDTFTALGNGVDLNGWTPDTVNTPGNSWEAGTDLDGTGSGGVTLAADGAEFGTIDTGVTNNVMRVDARVVCNTAKDSVYLGICATASFSGFGGQDGVYLQWDQGGDTLQVRQDGTTLVDQTSVSRTVGESDILSLRYDGTDLKVYVNDAEIVALRQEGYTIPANQDGQSYVIFGFTDADDDPVLEEFWAYGSTQAPAPEAWELVGGGNWELVGGGNWELV